MNNTNLSLAEMAQLLGASQDYRVLTRLKPREHFSGAGPEDQLRIAVVIDLETTGLDTLRDEPIEIGMLKFAYTIDGRVTHVIDNFSGFNEPTGPIPADITKLTGIDDAMVQGHRIDPAAVEAFIGIRRWSLLTMPASTGNSPNGSGPALPIRPGPAGLSGNNEFVTRDGGKVWERCRFSGELWNLRLEATPARFS